MKIRLGFVTHGEAPLLRDNELAVDVGSPEGMQNRLFDHHEASSEPSKFECSAAILMSRIDELEPLKEKEDVIIFCHPQPDMDCAVSAFLAVCYLNNIELNRDYVSHLLNIDGQIDQGKISPLSFDNNESNFNFYTFFLLLDNFIRQTKTQATNNWDIVKAYAEHYGLELSNTPDEKFIAYSFLFLMQLHENDDIDALSIVQSSYRAVPYMKALDGFLKSEKIDKRFKTIFTEIAAFIKVTLKEGSKEAVEAFKNNEYETFTVITPLRREPGKIIEVEALYIKLPFTSLPFVKTLRGTSFDLIGKGKIEILAFSPLDDIRRVVISVDPNSDISLKGLALALDRKTTEKTGNKRLKPGRYWKKSNGEELPDPLFPYQAPWYDGRGFDYTIVDVPSEPNCRFLTEEEIIDVLKGDWHRMAEEYDTPEYRHWESLPDK